MVAKLKRLSHRNVVPLLGITDSSDLEFVLARTPGMQLGEYIATHPDINRLDLVIVAPLPSS